MGRKPRHALVATTARDVVVASRPRMVLQALVQLGLPQDEVLRLVRARRAGVALMKNPRFLELQAILELAAQAFGAGAKRWFLQPEPKLGNVLPVSLLRDPESGPDLVKQVIYGSLRGTLP